VYLVRVLYLLQVLVVPVRKVNRSVWRAIRSTSSTSCFLYVVSRLFSFRRINYILLIKQSWQQHHRQQLLLNKVSFQDIQQKFNGFRTGYDSLRNSYKDDHNIPLSSLDDWYRRLYEWYRQCCEL
jgi:hypothetical protein